MERMLPDWITGYLDLTENSEPPFLFRAWCAISVIASALQRKCYMTWQFGERIYPNFYILLVGPSGSRKGTAMRQAKPFLDAIGIPYCADAITREAFIRRFAEAQTDMITDEGTVVTHSSFTVFSPEFTVFIGRENYRLVYDLTDIFDAADNWTYDTKHHSTDVVIGVWLNLLGATTPQLLQSALPNEAIGGGLTARMILVYGERAKLVPEPFLTPEQEQLRSKLITDLQSIHRTFGEFKCDDSFVKIHKDWYMSDDRPRLPEQFFEGYVERRSLHLRKLSIVFAASRSDDQVVTAEDFQRAYELLTKTESVMGKVFIGKGHARTATVISRVLRFIAANGTVTMSQLIEEFWTDVTSKQELENLLVILRDMRAIKIDVTDKGQRLIKFVPRSER